ncbi:hypothetical protein F5B20DRAFT_584813 [Whalleya microplaca]|nr:hypothetical protein F5B20DRAFT_584813 [Whalleya microplaca]
MPFSQNAVALVAAVTPLLSIAILTVGLRLYVRVALLKNPGLDDWLCLAALFCSLGTYLSNVIAVGAGFGSPVSSMTLEDRAIVLQVAWISPGIWTFSATLIKMSIVSSYLRIWSSKRFVDMCYILLVTLALFGLVVFLCSVFTCVPIRLAWALPSARPRGTCFNRIAFLFITSLGNTIIDLLIFAIPVPLIRKLQIPKKQQLALLVVFTIGVVVCFASVMRLTCIYRLRGVKDSSAEGIPLATWSGVENNLAIICACLPTLKLVITQMLPKLLAAATSSLSWKSHGRTRTFDENGPYRMQTLVSVDHNRDYNHQQLTKHGAGTIQVDSSYTIDVESAKSYDKEPRSFFNS